MSRILFYLVCGFWGLVCLHDIYWIGFFSFVLGIFFYLRFKKKGILFLWLLFSLWACCLTFKPNKPAQPGEYTIVSIKSNYAIAKNKSGTIVLYGIDNPNFDEVYQVSSLEKITNLKNLHQFSFADYLGKDQITYCANVKVQDYIKSKHSIKSKLYSRVKNNPVLLANLYGIQTKQNDALIQLGLPIIMVYYFLFYQLKKVLDEKKVHLVLILLLMVYGACFIYTISLVRFICFQIAKYFFKDWHSVLAFSMFFFLSMLPWHSLDFAFVFPLAYRLCFYYVTDPNKRWIAQKATLLICQFVYFHQVDLVLFLFFNIYRKIQLWNVLLAFFKVSIPYVNQWIGKFCFHYVPGILFFLVLFWFLQSKKKTLFVLLCCLPFIQTYADPFFHVYMFDIGQGDCTLIVEPFKRSAVMIDCGQNLYRDNIKDIVLPVLEDLQIHSLTALICTHDDFDHSGGKEELMKSIPVKQYITNREDQPNVSYPFYSLLPERDAKDENDESIVSYFTYDQTHYLWMGDASVDVERQILSQYKLDVDVLKLGHHGSNTSSSYTFLDKLRPKLGLVSVGRKNRYGHPSNTVISNCHDLGIEVLETKDVGMIHIFSFRNWTFFETATHLVGRIQ